MASATATRESPSYSSSRVQRAARLNNVEATKLLQQLQCLEKAKQHQCRMTNQDIRLISTSIDYIQAHSGNSQEAWRPPSAVPTEVTEEEKSEGPCFMYGERIISRKKRRFARPMSAVERSYGKLFDQEDSNSTSTWNEINDIPRPKSSCGNKNRPASSMSWVKLNDSHTSSDKDGSESTADTPRSGYTASRPTSAVSTNYSGRERDPWEDETTDVTKKILKAQARAQMGKRPSVYQSAGAVMTAQSSKKVRDLARKIRINSTQISLANVDPSLTRQGAVEDKPPKKPNYPRDFMGRRATTSDILNQNRPTLSAGAWRQHLGQNSRTTPVSISAQQKAMLEAKRDINESRKADVAEKVKHFMTKTHSHS